MQLTLGISPCPNDTFMFDALVHKKIDTEGIEFNVVMEDIAQLNARVLYQSIDVCKISYHCFMHVINQYQLSDAGSALGRGCGPLLIARDPDINLDNQALRVGIPGKFTTANLLCLLAYPHLNNKIEMIFSEIEDSLLNGKIDLGLIIHENRFTYADKGLFKLMDLGEFWENKQSLPIPLGGIAINRNLSGEIKKTVNSLIRKSVEYAFTHPASSATYVRQHAQEMNELVLQQHIELYVNEYSIELGNEGRRAIRRLTEEVIKLDIIEKTGLPLFV